MNEVYSSIGKTYNGEKAIISLTSWKARINTVSKTLYSLLQQCPGFHIVLVLSEEEFPQKEKELPENLMLFIENDIIELLWVYKNYKSFKKVLFTMDKYRDVPVISADDGQMYTENFAEKLYTIWQKNKNCIISNTQFKIKDVYFGCGARGILYAPNCLENAITFLTNDIIKTNHDDMYIGILAKINHIPWYFINKLNYRKNNFKVFKNDEKVGLTYNKMYNDSAYNKIYTSIKNIIQSYK